MDPWNSGRTTDENDVVNLRFIHLRVAQSFLDGLQRTPEEILVQLLETGTRDRRVKVDAVEQRVDLDVRLGRRRQGPFGAFAGRLQPTDRSLVLRQILLELPRELLHEVCHHTIVEVLPAKVRVAGRRFNL